MKTLLPKQQTWGRSKHVRRDERFLSLAQIDKLYHELKKHCNVCGNEFGNFQVVHPIHFWNRIYCTHAHVNEELSGMFTQKKKQHYSSAQFRLFPTWSSSFPSLGAYSKYRNECVNCTRYTITRITQFNTKIYKPTYTDFEKIIQLLQFIRYFI